MSEADKASEIAAIDRQIAEAKEQVRFAQQRIDFLRVRRLSMDRPLPDPNLKAGSSGS